MSNTLKNVLEGIEPESQYEQALKLREQKIRSFSPLGPPDLCYLTKQFQRSLLSIGKPLISGFFHYTYGVNTSSPAAISAYISNLLKLQEPESSWFSNGKWTIKKALYCIYDCFSKVDIHLEICFPGKMSLFGKNTEGQLISIDDKTWERGYISSVLRSMVRKRSPLIKIYKEFEANEDLERFLETVMKLILRKELTLENDKDGIDSCGSEVLAIISQYLLQKKRLVTAEGFFRKLSDQEPKFVFFLSEIFEKKSEYKEAVRHIASVLLRNPHIVSLLYKQSKYLLKLERYVMALKLAKIVVQLAPESFEAWYHLIDVLYHCKQYEMVLLTMNISPVSTIPSYDDGLDLNCEVTNPKMQKDPNYFINSQDLDKPDHRYTNGDDQSRSQTVYQELNEKLRSQLESLPSLSLDEQESKLFKILVKIERELGWEKLLSIRTQLFLTELELNIQSAEANEGFKKGNSSVNKLPAEDYEIYESNKLLSSENLPNVSMNDISFFGVKLGAESLVDQRKKMQKDVKRDPEFSDDSEDEHELPSFLKLETPEDQNEEANLQKNLNEIKNSKNISNWEQKRSKKITEQTNETSETEPNLQLKGNYKKSMLPTNNEPIDLKEEEESKEQDSDDDKQAPPKNQSTKSIKEEVNKPPMENKAQVNPAQEVPLTTGKKISDEYQLTLKRDDIIGSLSEFEAIGMKKKRACSKLIDTLFNALFEDLTMMYDWQSEDERKPVSSPKNQGHDLNNEHENEDTQDDTEEKFDELSKISGINWALRGALAERLFRNRYAEQAYRKAIDRGFSLFAWNRLLRIYLETNNYKAALVCIAQILEELEVQGLPKFLTLPKWIEDGILEIIFGCGIIGFSKMMKELDFEDEAVLDLVKKAVYWKVEGIGRAEK